MSDIYSTFDSDDILDRGQFALMTKGNYYARRPSEEIEGIVIHTAGAYDDENQPGDTVAERVTSYGRSPTCPVSWHCVVDSDSIVWSLPEDVVAWHAWGYNRGTLGIELGTRPSWLKDKVSKRWKEQNHMLMVNAARVVAYWCHRYDISIVDTNEMVSMAGKQGDLMKSGIFGHDATTPYRKRNGKGAKVDPGKHFQWGSFIDMVSHFHWERSAKGDCSRPMSANVVNVPTDDGYEQVALAPNYGYTSGPFEGWTVEQIETLRSLSLLNKAGVFKLKAFAVS